MKAPRKQRAAHDLKLTGGKWDPAAWPVYFIASDVDTLGRVQQYHRYLLIAVNEIRDTEIETVREFVEKSGCAVFIDSGVFNLSTRHAAKHDLTMDQALSLAPADVDGFDDLFEKYVRLAAEFGEQVWGYIEIDQGGKANKIKTRTRLESLGLRPIPVYHPLNDGWDYFDELASQYDRICFGNLVQADIATRKRLLATLWERRRKYPHLWIHALGVTASELAVAYPCNSCDSSTWLSGIRWGQHDAKAANKRLWSLGEGFNYDREAEVESPRGHRQAVRLAGYDAGMVSRTMRIIRHDQERGLAADIGMFDR